MSKNWQLQEAKNKFSQVVDCACNEGPQIVTRHGKETLQHPDLLIYLQPLWPTTWYS